MAWLKAYFEKYEYLHEAIAGAVNEDEWTAFSFWYDKVGCPLHIKGLAGLKAVVNWA